MRTALKLDEEPPDFPISTRTGGVRPGIKIGDPDDWYDMLYGDDDRQAALMAGASAQSDRPN